MKIIVSILLLILSIPLIADVISVEEILSKIEASNGGREEMKKIKSFFISGKITVDENTFDFTITKKRPYYFLMEVERGNGFTLITGFDGNKFWRVIKHDLMIQKLEIKKEEMNSLQQFTDFDGRLLSLDGSANEGITYEGTERIDRVDCYILKYIENEAEIHHYIDSRTFRDVQQVRVESVDDEVIQSKTYFSDPHKVGPFWLCYSIETKVNEKVTQKINIDTIKLSLGVFDFIFNEPKENLSNKSVTH